MTLFFSIIIGVLLWGTILLVVGLPVTFILIALNDHYGRNDNDDWDDGWDGISTEPFPPTGNEGLESEYEAWAERVFGRKSTNEEIDQMIVDAYNKSRESWVAKGWVSPR